MNGLGVWGEFFLKLFIILAGIYLIILITPKLAAFIDKQRKKSGTADPTPEELQPERVEDKNIKSEKSEKIAEDGDDNEYKSDKK